MELLSIGELKGVLKFCTLLHPQFFKSSSSGRQQAIFKDEYQELWFVGSINIYLILKM